jgi:tetratricopeptide (TPR) repeat protein
MLYSRLPVLGVTLGAVILLGCSVAVYEHLHPVRADEARVASVAEEEAATPNEAEGVSQKPREIIPFIAGTAGDYLSARFASMSADHANAAKFLDKAFTETPPKKQMLALSIRHHLLSGDVKRAMTLAHQERADVEKPPVLSLLFFVEALHAGKMDDARRFATQIKPEGLQSLALPFIQSWMEYSASGAAQRVTIADNLKQGTYQSLQHYHEALQYRVIGDIKAAANAYELALETPNATLDATLFSAIHFYSNQHNQEHARSVIKAAQETRGRDAIWNVGNVDEYLNAEYTHSVASVTSVKEGIAEIFANIGTLLMREGVAEEAQSFLYLSLYLRPDDMLTRLTLGEAQETTKRYPAAITTYQRITAPAFVKDTATLFLARTHHADKQPQKARALLTAMKGVRTAYSVSVMLGDLERIEKRYDDAAVHYTRAMEAIGTLKSYDWPLLYQRGIVYDLAGHWSKAEQDFERALELRPDEPQVLNYLAYSWLMRDEKLEEARKILKKAVEAAPNEPNILDSYGFALYKLGEYEEALEQLDKALSLLPSDPTMNDHYGDVLWRLGRTTEARYHWERALLFKPVEKGAQERLQHKLKHGL